MAPAVSSNVHRELQEEGGMPRVFVVLATYNATPFLRPLLDSVRQQSWTDWTLLARDDASSDATVQILRQIAAEDPRLNLLEPDGLRHGPTGNFAVLMQRAYDLGADYVFLADQDDVWQPHKIARLMERMRQIEGSAARPRPLLVYSDLQVVDRDLRPLHRSFVQCSRLPHDREAPWKTLLGRNFVPGCSAVVNRSLLELALPLPDAAVLHDWWITWCAASAGRIAFVQEPLVLYRRHDSNVTGPIRFWQGLNPWRESWRNRWQVGTANFRRSLAQLHALSQRLDQRSVDVPPGVRQCLDQFCHILHCTPGFRGVYKLCRLGVPQLDLPRRILYYVCLLLLCRPTAGAKTGS